MQVIFLAQQRPTDLSAQIAAAYACDRAGDEHQALRFDEIAWALSIPYALRVECKRPANSPSELQH